MNKQQETPINNDAVKSWTVTPEGWLQIDIPVRRPGVLVYDTAKGDAFTAKEAVSEKELFAPESMKTLIGKPVTVSRHPKGGKVTAGNYRAVNAGTVTDAFRSGDDLMARVLVQDANAIAQIKQDKRLRGASAGYVCRDKPKVNGNIDGEEHDTMQVGIEYNHISIVRNPRNKSAVFNLDGKEEMATIEELEEKIEELQTNNDSLTATNEKQVKKIGTLTAELAETRKKIINMDSDGKDAYERGLKDGKQQHAIAEHAKAMGINTDSMDPKTVKLAIISKVNDKMNTDSLSDDQIDTALEMALAAKPAVTFRQQTRIEKQKTNNDADGDDGAAGYLNGIFGDGDKN